MSRMIFIADVHLTLADDGRRKLLAAFLEGCLQCGDRLYILGDLFDYWANNRTVVRSHAWVFELLSRLINRGCPVGLLAGNRDFLLRESMLKGYGIEYLGEESTVAFDQKKFFLSHGHLLCLDDIRFLNYRSRMWPVFRALDRVLPGWIENRLAAAFQQKSKQVIESQDPSRFTFTRGAIEEKFRQGFDYVICGHTHQEETFDLEGHRFYALPSFCDAPGSYLLYEDGYLAPALFDLHKYT